MPNVAGRDDATVIVSVCLECHDLVARLVDTVQTSPQSVQAPSTRFGEGISRCLLTLDVQGFNDPINFLMSIIPRVEAQEAYSGWQANRLHLKDRHVSARIAPSCNFRQVDLLVVSRCGPENGVCNVL
jgi:hypothetical protein